MRGVALLALTGLLGSGLAHSEPSLPQWREPNTGMAFVQLVRPGGAGLHGALGR